MKVCCGTTNLRYGPTYLDTRRRPLPLAPSRVIYHVRGTKERFWHWEDQTSNLADLSSYGPNLQPYEY